MSPFLAASRFSRTPRHERPAAERVSAPAAGRLPINNTMKKSRQCFRRSVAVGTTRYRRNRSLTACQRSAPSRVSYLHHSHQRRAFETPGDFARHRLTRAATRHLARLAFNRLQHVTSVRIPKDSGREREPPSLSTRHTFRPRGRGRFHPTKREAQVTVGDDSSSPPLHFVRSRFGSVSLLHFKVSHRWPFAVELFAVCLFEQNAE